MLSKIFIDRLVFLQTLTGIISFNSIQECGRILIMGQKLEKVKKTVTTIEPFQLLPGGEIGNIFRTTSIEINTITKVGYVAQGSFAVKTWHDAYQLELAYDSTTESVNLWQRTEQYESELFQQDLEKELNSFSEEDWSNIAKGFNGGIEEGGIK